MGNSSCRLLCLALHVIPPAYVAGTDVSIRAGCDLGGGVYRGKQAKKAAGYSDVHDVNWGSTFAGPA